MTLDEENGVDLLAGASLLCPGCLEFEAMLFLQKNQKLLWVVSAHPITQTMILQG